MKNNLLIFLLIVCGCSQAQKKESTASLLDPGSFKEKLSMPGVVILDVRTPDEVAEGIIPGAVVMDFNAPDFKNKVSKLDKNKTYLVYCKVGGRSSMTISLMESKGIKNVYHLDGGYDAWVQNGFETVKP